jgi:undecaprenyl-diphosphatase
VSLFQALLLGLLQGATEFLPVSSSGHLVVVPWLLGWPNPGLAFIAVLHLGTLLAVLFHMRAEVAAVVAGWWRSVRRRSLELPEERLGWLIVISAIPGSALGFLAEDYFEALFASPRSVAFLLLVTGLLLVAGERLGRRVRSMDEARLQDAVWIGLAQALAIAPGISRSGATIAGGLLRDLRREDAARFSFLMVIPIIIGAAGLQLAKLAGAGIDAGEGLNLLAGFVVAFLAGYAAIGFLLSHLRTRTLLPFALYCWGLGFCTLIVTFIR